MNMEVAMNSVANLMSVNDVLLDTEADSKQALFVAIGRLWEKNYSLVADDVLKSLTAREKSGSTGLGQGVAIPHARIKGLTKAVCAFVRPKFPIDFDSPDGNPVSYCFVLLVPAQASEEHLKILADAAGMLSNTEFREQLGMCATAEQIHQLFSEWHSPISDRVH
jgi:PTS system nitrogen regulatory IIA component